MFILSRAVHAAAHLGVADQLLAGPKTIRELACETGTHEPTLARLLRTLVTFGVFVEQPDGCFALNELAQELRSGTPASQRDFILCMGSRWQARAWEDLSETIRTGEPYFERATGVTMFDYLAEHPQDAVLFEKAMSRQTGQSAAALAAACDLDGVRHIVDVGGGNGTLLAALLVANPHAQGVLVERPACAAGARPALADAGVGDRCVVQEADICHDPLPIAAVYVLKNVLHDWNDERAVQILQNCRRAAQGRARLLVIEVLARSPAPRPDEALMDLAMLVLTGGRERTREHYGQLLESADWTLERVIATGTAFSVLEATPAECTRIAACKSLSG